MRHALRAGFTIKEILNLTKIDRWFLTYIQEAVDFEVKVAGSGTVSARPIQPPAPRSATR
jgi:hypothetical protein